MIGTEGYEPTGHVDLGYSVQRMLSMHFELMDRHFNLDNHREISQSVLNSNTGVAFCNLVVWQSTIFTPRNDLQCGVFRAVTSLYSLSH